MYACVRAPPTVLQQCMSPSGVTSQHFMLQTGASSPRNFQGTLHKKTKRTEHEGLTSASGRDLEIEKYNVCDILRFVCPVFTWFCLFLQSCESATEQ